MQPEAFDMLEFRNFCQGSFELFSGQIQGIVLNILFGSLQGLQQNAYLPQGSTGSLAFAYGSSPHMHSSSPATQFHNDAPWLDTFRDLISVVFQDLDLCVRQVVLVEIRDLFEQFETLRIVEKQGGQCLLPTVRRANAVFDQVLERFIKRLFPNINDLVLERLNSTLINHRGLKAWARCALGDGVLGHVVALTVDEAVK